MIIVSCLGSDVVDACVARLRLAEQQLVVFEDVVHDLMDYTHFNVLLLQDLADVLDSLAPELVPYVREACMQTFDDTFTGLCSTGDDTVPAPDKCEQLPSTHGQEWDALTTDELLTLLRRERDPISAWRCKTYIQDVFRHHSEGVF